MKTNTLLGIILIALGVLALSYQAFTYTTRHKAVDLGPIEVTSENTKTIPIPPIVGGIALAGGIVLLVVSLRKR